MDYKTAFMRSLWDVTSSGRPAHQECETVGDVACGRRVQVPHQPKSGSVQGFKWLTGQLQPVDLDRPWSADFVGYATQWEQRYSILVPDRNYHLPVSPVVNHIALQASGTFPVIAHYGAVSENNVIVPRKYAVGSRDAGMRRSPEQLEWILSQGIHAYVEQDYPDAGDWGPLAPGSSGYPVGFTVLTDLEGRILANLGTFGSEPALVSVDPLDYVMVGTILVDLAKIGGKLILAMARKAAQKEVTSLAKRKLAGDLEGAAAKTAGKEIALMARRSTNYASKTGITRSHFKLFQDAARETNLVALVRNGKEAAIPLIEKKCPGKPMIFKFKSSPTTGILTATVQADKELVLNSKYILINESREAVRRLPSGALETVKLERPLFWDLEPGQVIDPVVKKPVVGDYDLMGVYSPASPGQNITLATRKYGEVVKNRTSPLFDEFSAKVNGKFKSTGDQPRILHGAQDQFGGFAGGATAFFPDGTVLYLESEAEVEAFYKSVGRETIEGAHPRPGPGVETPPNELAARQGR